MEELQGIYSTLLVTGKYLKTVLIALILFKKC